MRVPILQKVTHDFQTLDRAPDIIGAEVRKVLDGVVGKMVIERVQSRMKKDQGGERASVQKRVTGNRLSLTLEVFSDDVRAAVDEEGRRPGAPPPPSRPGTEFYAWVLRKGLPDKIRRRAAARAEDEDNKFYARHMTDAQAVRIVAKSIGRKGIKARRPFERTVRDSDLKKYVVAGLQIACDRGVGRMNA
jgi:hypothetical protein